MLLVFTACNQVVPGAPEELNTTSTATIWIIKDDYVPGELVDINGAGWQPGESIELFDDDHADKTWSHTAKVTADENGTFYYEFRLPS